MINCNVKRTVFYPVLASVDAIHQYILFDILTWISKTPQSNYIFFANAPGEANFLGGVASVKGVKGFDSEAAKKRFFEIYLDKVISLPFCFNIHL